MDLQEFMARRNERNRFCRRLGIQLTELAPGHAKAVKTVTEDDLNPLGLAHGGLYFTMADTAAGSALAAYGHKAVTLNAQYNFFRSATLGDVLTAESHEIKRGGTICAYEIRVTDQKGTLLGTGTFTFFDLKEPIEDLDRQ